MTFRLLCLFLLWAVPFVGEAQQLLWERIYNPPGAQNTYLMYCSLTPQGLLLVPGCTRPLGLGTCQGYQQMFGLYDLNGRLVREQLGRRQYNADQALRQGTGSRYWWAGNQSVCTTAPVSAGSYVQRLTLRGDTLPAWPLLAPVPPNHLASAVLEDGRRLLVTSLEQTSWPTIQVQRYTLTSVDTASGQVRWRRAYDLPSLNVAYPIDLVKTPRGGYLISGDGAVPTGTYAQHLFLETDSLGNQLKQRLIYPLGSNFNNGRRSETWSNLLALPNAQGYLASGTADSTPSPSLHYRRGYLMRLDTALNVTWVYAHNPAADGLLSQDANRVRLLPDGSAALLVRDMIPTRNDGSPNLRLVQIDLTTGRHLATYPLPSSSQHTIRVFDWQWLGDGTLVLCGQSTQAGTGVGVTQGYLARWDFRATPLSIGRPALVSGEIQLQALPTPASESLRLEVSGPVPAASRVELLELATGRTVLTHPLPANGRTLQVDVQRLAPGVYAARLLHAAQLLATAKVVVVR